MRRSFAPVLSLGAALAFAHAARAQHDVPVWYVDYEVTIQANHTAATRSFGDQPTRTTWVFERTFSASAKLDMRSEGSVIITTQAAVADPDKFKNMSQAEMMQYSQDMLAAMQYTANWMPGPVEIGDEPDAMLKLMQAGSVPVRFRYTETTVGSNLSDETGSKYDYERTRTGTVSGAVIYPGDQYKVEVNTQSKKYWLLLPYTGQDLDPTTRALKWETVEKTRPAGGGAWNEQRTTDDATADWLPAIKLDLPPGFGATPLIEGNITTPDTIKGEKTFNGTFEGGAVPVPVTVTYRYTVSDKPLPAKAGAAKK